MLKTKQDIREITRKNRAKKSQSVLTDEQKRVVFHPGGHAIVGAVAGAGKSHTLAYRNIYLMREGVDAKKILNLMFNTSAAKQFRGRVEKLAKQYSLEVPVVHTFHAFGMRVLDGMIEKGWLPDGELVESDWDLFRLAKSAINDALSTIDTAEHQDITNEVLTDFLSVIDEAKAGMIEPSTLDAKRFFEAYGENSQLYGLAFASFESARKQAGLYAFSDLIYDPVCRMRADKTVFDWVANRYDHLLVDEYQDVNESQQFLIRAIAGSKAAVMVVGDEDQCIYEWRGAKPFYMAFGFERDFPGTTRYMLSRTFRFGSTACLMASETINHNIERTPKVCVPDDNNPNTRITLTMASDWKSQGKGVVDALAAWTAKGCSLSDVAVLVREYSQSVAVEAGLMDAGIPYRIVGAPPAFDRPEILALRGYMALATPGGLTWFDDKEKRYRVADAMLRVPTLYLRGSDRERLAGKIADSPDDILSVLQSAMDEQQHDWQRGKLAARIALLQGVSGYANLSPGRAIKNIVADLGLYRALRSSIQRVDVADEKVRLCQEFVAYAQNADADTIAEFLTQANRMVEKAQGEDAPLLITSVHRAKGMEWPHVILPELAEGRFPAYNPKAGTPDKRLLESERRLFYVALTRAQQQLTLVCASDRRLLRALKTGQCEVPKNPKASRFLYESNIYSARHLLRAADAENMTWLKSYCSSVGLSFLATLDHPVANTLQQIQESTQVFRLERGQPSEPPAIIF